ncbi:MAG: hypothetical protein K6E40_18105 [Desulfovibrio sp.]|nr:hypothetical protein [Desulfovibrio sp.]
MRKGKTAPGEGREQESAFYATAGVQPDGTLQEIGGEGRTWPDEAAYHRARGWRAGTVVHYFPADFSRQEDDGRTVQDGALAGAACVSAAIAAF